MSDLNKKVGRKAANEKDVVEWLGTNAPHITLLKYGGHPKEKSAFKDVNRNKEFEYRYDRLKQELSRDSGYIFGASKEEMGAKRMSTNLKKYGSVSPLGNEEVREKAKQSIIKIYGEENVFANKDIQEQIRQTNLQKYGYETPMHSKEIRDRGVQAIKDNLPEVIEKRKASSLENNGYVSTFSLPEVQAKIKHTNIEKKSRNGDNGN